MSVAANLPRQQHDRRCCGSDAAEVGVTFGRAWFLRQGLLFKDAKVEQDYQTNFLRSKAEVVCLVLSFAVATVYQMYAVYQRFSTLPPSLPEERMAMRVVTVGLLVLCGFGTLGFAASVGVENQISKLNNISGSNTTPAATNSVQLELRALRRWQRGWWTLGQCSAVAMTLLVAVHFVFFNDFSIKLWQLGMSWVMTSHDDAASWPTACNATSVAPGVLERDDGCKYTFSGLATYARILGLATNNVSANDVYFVWATLNVMVVCRVATARTQTVLVPCALMLILGLLLSTFFGTSQLNVYNSITTTYDCMALPFVLVSSVATHLLCLVLLAGAALVYLSIIRDRIRREFFYWVRVLQLEKSKLTASLDPFSKTQLERWLSSSVGSEPPRHAPGENTRPVAMPQGGSSDLSGSRHDSDSDFSHSLVMRHISTHLDLAEYVGDDGSRHAYHTTLARASSASRRHGSSVSAASLRSGSLHTAASQRCSSRRSSRAATETSSFFWAIAPSELDLVEQAAAGAEGIVWRAVYKSRTVAAKELFALSDLMHQDSGLEALAAETSILAQLHHPNVLRFLGLCRISRRAEEGMEEAVDRVLIVTEWCPVNLRDLLDRHHSCSDDIAPGSLVSTIILDARKGSDATEPASGATGNRLTQHRRLRICLQLARGMAYLHDSDIVHRDLKPENVLLDATGNVRICDFGLSVTTSTSGNSLSASSFGTPGYMAPEIEDALRTKDDDALSACILEPIDMFAFGIVVWELFAKAPLVLKDAGEGEGDTSVRPGVSRARLVAHVDDRGLVDACPAVVRALIQQCNRQEPAERPSFVAAVSIFEEQIQKLPQPQSQQVTDTLPRTIVPRLPSSLSSIGSGGSRISVFSAVHTHRQVGLSDVSSFSASKERGRRRSSRRSRSTGVSFSHDTTRPLMDQWNEYDRRGAIAADAIVKRKGLKMGCCSKLQLRFDSDAVETAYVRKLVLSSSYFSFVKVVCLALFLIEVAAIAGLSHTASFSDFQWSYVDTISTFLSPIARSVWMGCLAVCSWHKPWNGHWLTVAYTTTIPVLLITFFVSPIVAESRHALDMWISANFSYDGTFGSLTTPFARADSSFVNGLLAVPEETVCAGRLEASNGLFSNVSLCQSLNFQFSLGSVKAMSTGDEECLASIAFPVGLLLLEFPVRYYLPMLFVCLFGVFWDIYGKMNMASAVTDDLVNSLLGSGGNSSCQFNATDFVYGWWDVAFTLSVTLGVYSSCLISSWSRDRRSRVLFVIQNTLMQRNAELVDDASSRQYKFIIESNRNQELDDISNSGESRGSRASTVGMVVLAR